MATSWRPNPDGRSESDLCAAAMHDTERKTFDELDKSDYTLFTVAPVLKYEDASGFFSLGPRTSYADE